MGNHSPSRTQYEMTSSKPISWVGQLALLVLLFAIFDKVNASPMDPLKHGRSVTSSLIPFPRVGRSVEPLEDEDSRVDRHSRSAPSSRLLYGQKRTVQKRQALIPFPRTGKRASSVPIRHSIRAPNKYGLNLLETEGYPLGMENFYGGDRASTRDYETMQAIQNLLREMQLDN